MEIQKYTPKEIYSNKILLKEFLYFYQSLTNEKNLNASCEKCIKDYYHKIINKMETINKDYILKSKYQGIFVDGVYLTNGNLTNDLAKKLLKNKKAQPSLFFEKYPIEEVQDQVEHIQVEKKRGRKTKA